jgi:hypothetical protein
MKKILMVLSVAAVILAPAPSLALTYDFSFTGSLGTVTGEIDGLSPGYNGVVPLILIDSAPPQFLVSPTPAKFFTTDPTHNNIVVDAAGNVTSYDIFAEFQVYATLNLSSACLTCNNLNADTPDGPISDIADSFPTFTAGPASTTPVPTSAGLFATVLGLVGLIALRRKRGIRAQLKYVQQLA